MDSIYSRKRIRIPKLKMFYSKYRLNKNKVRLLIIIIIAIFTFYMIINSIEPIFEGLCQQKAISIASNIINLKSSKVLEKYNYTNIVNIMKEANDKNIVITDVTVINKIASDIVIAVEQGFMDLENEKIGIPMGALTGSKYLSGIGPNINIKIIPAGNIMTELKTEFKSQGINQTIYRVYLEINCSAKILSSYKTIKQDVISQILLVETIIVGDVPQTYYNLDGMTGDDTLNLIE